MRLNTLRNLKEKMVNAEYHESVMVGQVVENLHIKKGSKIIDATLGTAGHTAEILKAGGHVLGIEADPVMLAIAKKRLPEGNFVLGNFIDIDKIATKNNFSKVWGIVFDLGVTNIHLTTGDRGFSFGNPDSELDMRLNPETQGLKGSDLLNALREDHLVELFSETLEKGAARWVARRVIARRPITKVGDFLEAVKGLKGKPGINVATLPFLAVRIAVNRELDNLKVVLPKAFELLEDGGRLIVISFHSGEDRIVKEFMSPGELIVPREGEIEKNPRARSAKMRVLEKI